MEEIMRCSKLFWKQKHHQCWESLLILCLRSRILYFSYLIEINHISILEIRTFYFFILWVRFLIIFTLPVHYRRRMKIWLFLSSVMDFLFKVKKKIFWVWRSNVPKHVCWKCLVMIIIITLKWPFLCLCLYLLHISPGELCADLSHMCSRVL